MNIKKQSKYSTLAILIIIVLTMIGIAYYTLPSLTPARTPVVIPSNTKPEADKKTATKNEFNKSLYSISEPGSLWWIINKNRPAGEDYIPPQLSKPDVPLNSTKSDEENSIRQDIAHEVVALFNAASQQGFSLIFASGYRSYQLQSTYYNNYVRTSGQAEADRYSAKPGTSEHQTGLAFDIARSDRKNYLEQAFGDDPAAQWVATHAHEYGFIIRYPQDKESVTGYMYEPWHLRYVGKELAYELFTKKQTLEEFFNITQ
jgi:zinc D-Ala-D-Ala carboxypeptidase